MPELSSRMDLALIARRLDAYERLVRLDKPIGALLLLWPTLWALWLASGGRPRADLLLVFVAGTWLHLLGEARLPECLGVRASWGDGSPGRADVDVQADLRGRRLQCVVHGDEALVLECVGGGDLLVAWRDSTVNTVSSRCAAAGPS